MSHILIVNSGAPPLNKAVSVGGVTFTFAEIQTYESSKRIRGRGYDDVLFARPARDPKVMAAVLPCMAGGHPLDSIDTVCANNAAIIRKAKVREPVDEAERYVNRVLEDVAVKIEGGRGM